MKKTIQGKEWEIPRLTRAQMREMRKKGFDVVAKAFKLSNVADGVPITGEELDAMLDTAFPGREAELDAIGLSGQVELGTAVLGELFAIGNELKN